MFKSNLFRGLLIYTTLLLTTHFPGYKVQAGDLCELIEVGTTPDVNDVVRLGQLQKKFDSRFIQDKSELYYMPYSKSEIIFYV